MSRGPPPLYRFVADRSGQSNTLAVVLLLGITLTGTGVIVTFGATAVGDTQASADLGQAEQAMTQFDSRASLVAHGTSDAQRVRVGTNGQGNIRLDENAGQMRVEIVNETTGTTEDVVMNATMGAVVYERAGTTIAYQGGGVWRGEDNASVMVSPPEFNYRGGTLTLPLVLVRGQAASGGQMVLRQRSPSTGLFPVDGNASRSNPLDDGSVNVTVESQYYQAWGRYFAQRTAGNVSYDHPNETVTIELIVPFQEDFDSALATTDPGGVTVNGAGSPPPGTETGVPYPTVDGEIENEISNCQSGGCDTTWSSGDTLGSGKTYFRDGDFSGSVNFDTSGGDVELVVNGDVNFKNSDVTVSGSGGNVTVYTREDYSLSGNIFVNDPSNNASKMRTLVHSDGEVSLGKNTKYVGLIYAPGSSVTFDGGGSQDPNLKGALVGETASINGNPNEIQYDSSVEDIDLGLGSGGPNILYLHVSKTEVEVDD